MIIISTLGGYAPPTYYEEGLFGGAAYGWAGAPQRLVECLSYFTELSNVMVALVSTVLSRRGRVGRWLPSPVIWENASCPAAGASDAGGGPPTCARS